MSSVTGAVLGALALASPRAARIATRIAGIGTSAALSAYFLRTFDPRSTFAGCPLLIRLPASCGDAVALTFDDGPHPETTPRLLDTLAEFHAKATFFFVGTRASAYPALVERAAREGHAIGVHGLHHRTMVLDNARQIEHDLKEATRRIGDAANIPLPRPLLLRPPYGFKTRTLCQTAHRLRYAFVAWSLDARDYDPVDATRLTRTVSSRLRPRDIVLFHERPGHPATLQALPRLLRRCREKQLRALSLIGTVGDFGH